MYNIFNIKSRKDIFNVTNKVLIDTDYACLIAIGAPKDEYECETLMIADLIIENEMIICTSEMVCDVFKEMFEEDFVIEEFDYISTEINKKT